MWRKLRDIFITKERALMIGISLIVFLGLLFSPFNTTTVKEGVGSKPPLWFVNFDDNVIHFKPQAEISQRFTNIVHNAINHSQPLSILHIGDSHIQADFFTGETRKLLSSWLGDTVVARGFTFPYQIVGSNNPDDYEVKWKGNWERNRPAPNIQSKLGVAGISISTSDTLSEFAISLKSKGKEMGWFDMVKILSDSEDNGAIPSPKGFSTIVHSDINSTTYKLPDFVQHIDIQITWNKSAGEKLTLYGVELINSKSKLLYNAAGVNGASVQSFLQSENFSQLVSTLSPNLVIVSLGTNDTYNPNFNADEFRLNLVMLVSKIKSALPNALILLSTPGDHLMNRVSPNPRLELAHEVIFSVAGEMDCGVWDFYRVMGGAGSVNHWAEVGLFAPDKLHLNRNGYKFKGALLFEALVKLTGDEFLVNSKYHLANE
jgi:lysophospholipase L1-like esterase